MVILFTAIFGILNVKGKALVIFSLSREKIDGEEKLKIHQSYPVLRYRTPNRGRVNDASPDTFGAAEAKSTFKNLSRLILMIKN